jgi:predicted amidohydrolase YtcJ
MALARFSLFIAPEETMSAEQALVLLTREAERARGHEDGGTLAPGQAASFIHHGTDILRKDITPPELLGATVALTVKDGQPVWSDGTVVPEGGWRK